MWRKVSSQEEKCFISEAINFTSNHVLYGQWMMKVIEQWPIASAQNLTDKHINQQAWVGHAACYMSINCPEYITRKAWGSLTNEQQSLANLQADIAIDAYKNQSFETRARLFA